MIFQAEIASTLLQSADNLKEIGYGFVYSTNAATEKLKPLGWIMKVKGLQDYVLGYCQDDNWRISSNCACILLFVYIEEEDDRELDLEDTFNCFWVI